MTGETHFVNRSLINGLYQIYQSSRFLAVCSFLFIIFISSIIPFSIFWLIQIVFLHTSIISISSPYLSIFLTVWSTLEVIFLIYQSYLYSKIQKKVPAPHVTSIERDHIVSSVLSSMKNLPNTLSKWFMNRPFQDIDRQSLLGWLAFAFYSKKIHELDDEDYEEIHLLIRKIEIDYQIEISDEVTDSASHMKHILDPVRVIFRPLAFYVFTDTFLNGILSSSIFYLKGYQFLRIGHLSLWTYYNASDNKEENDEDPIIFFHGIGAGLIMYQPFIARIHRQFSKRRRIILISMTCICMRYPSLKDIPNMSQTVESMKLIFDYYQLKKAIFIGHR